MKKIVLVLILILSLAFTGCSKNMNYEILAFGNSTSSEMSSSYKLFNGTKDTKLTVGEGESVEVKVDIVTKSGTLDAFIYKDESKYDYEGHDISTSSFTVTLSEPGDYTIKVKAKKHKGSYSFTW